MEAGVGAQEQPQVSFVLTTETVQVEDDEEVSPFTLAEGPGVNFALGAQRQSHGQWQATDEDLRGLEDLIETDLCKEWFELHRQGQVDDQIRW